MAEAPKVPAPPTGEKLDLNAVAGKRDRGAEQQASRSRALGDRLKGMFSRDKSNADKVLRQLNTDGAILASQEFRHDDKSKYQEATRRSWKRLGAGRVTRKGASEYDAKHKAQVDTHYAKVVARTGKTDAELTGAEKHTARVLAIQDARIAAGDVLISDLQEVTRDPTVRAEFNTALNAKIAEQGRDLRPSEIARLKREHVKSEYRERRSVGKGYHQETVRYNDGQTGLHVSAKEPGATFNLDESISKYAPTEQNGAAVIRTKSGELYCIMTDANGTHLITRDAQGRPDITPLGEDPDIPLIEFGKPWVVGGKELDVRDLVLRYKVDASNALGAIQYDLADPFKYYADLLQKEPARREAAANAEAARVSQEEAMVGSQRFKDIRTTIKGEVLAEHGVKSIAEIKDPVQAADVLKQIHERAATEYRKTEATAQPESATDTAEADLKAKAEAHSVYEDKLLELYGDGSEMSYEDAAAEALRVATEAVQSDEARAQRTAELADRDAEAVQLSSTLSPADRAKLRQQGNFDSVFKGELARYGEKPTVSQITEAYDRTLGLLQKEARVEGESILQQARDSGEIQRALLEETAKALAEKDAKGTEVPDEATLEALATKIAVARISQRRTEALAARGGSTVTAEATASAAPRSQQGEPIIRLDADSQVADGQKAALQQTLNLLRAQLDNAETDTRRDELSGMIGNIEQAINGPQIRVDVAQGDTTEATPSSEQTPRAILTGLGISAEEAVTMIGSLPSEMDPTMRSELMQQLSMISELRQTGNYDPASINSLVSQLRNKYIGLSESADSSNPGSERTTFLKALREFLVELVNALPGAVVEAAVKEIPVPS